MSQTCDRKQFLLDELIIQVWDDIGFDEDDLLRLLSKDITFVAKKVKIELSNHEVDLYGLDAYIEFSQVYNMLETR